MKNKTLTKADWLEIYCALNSKKSSATVDGDAKWQKHLDRIMEKIGPDGEDAFNRNHTRQVALELVAIGNTEAERLAQIANNVLKFGQLHDANP